MVSVIIPVFNVDRFLSRALESTQEQGLPPDRVEVIAINDGSTDASRQILDDFAASHSNVHIIHQTNSGSPARPRNAGLDIATGKYVFFLDADDELTGGALRDLTAFADQHGSEIVLAKMDGLGGRIPARSSFAETVANADFIREKLFNTLSPCKLFRRDFIERLQLRFPEHLRRGEDPPFVARAYLNASTISVFADRTCYLVRDRGDGTNLTSSGTNPLESLARFEALTQAILENTDAGTVRDAAMRRPMRLNFPTIVSPKLLKLTTEEQERVVDSVRQTIGASLTEPMMESIDPLDRIKLKLVISDNRPALSDLIRWCDTRTDDRIVLGEAGWEFRFSDNLKKLIGPDDMYSPEFSAMAKLTSLKAQGSKLTLHAQAWAAGAVTPPESAWVRWQRRGSNELIEPLSTTTPSHETEAAVSITATVDTEQLANAVWDAFVVQRFGEHESVKRLGASRNEGLSAGDLYSQGREEALGCTYFTKFGNLSLDIGFMMHPELAPRANVVGVTDGGGVTILVSVDGDHPSTITTVSDSGTRLSGQQLSPNLHAVNLRDPGTYRIAVHNGFTQAHVGAVRGLVVPTSLRRTLRVDKDGTVTVMARRRFQIMRAK
ncbi:glycosyltransferase family 2 protein [Brachybacterium tyrofermentans]|uniref:glycosyltransferase family 2 protein n=1 Tax=Brachybacterium tyrofermentans TaxID=47848 RepID=UPI003FCFAD08